MDTVVNTVNKANSAMGGNLYTSYIIGGVIFLVVVIGLYYLYKFLYSSAGYQASVDLLGNTVAMNKVARDSASSKDVVGKTEITGILNGGEYSTSFWVYVADTKGFSTTPGNNILAHLMEISTDRFSTSSKKNTLLFVGLNPVNASLIVRQSTSEPSEQINNSLTTRGEGTGYPLTSLITNYSTATFGADDRCDITGGIEYQRWVLVTVVGNGRTLDVYIDGKLARSCVYKASFDTGSSSGKATAYFGLDNGGNLKGYFSNAKFYNYALTPDAVWALYQAGPEGYVNILDFFKNLFNVNIGFGTVTGLNA
jgi:hypothetical protein